MRTAWKQTIASTVPELNANLSKLETRRWICRGQHCEYKRITPSIDRGPAGTRSRADKLASERESIARLRRAAREGLTQGEQALHQNRVVSLMVLRHHGVQTRLVDWSAAPWVAAWFACSGGEGQTAGELWAFDQET